MARSKIKTEKELLDKLDLLGIEDEEQRKEVTCSLIGHSQDTNLLLWILLLCKMRDSIGRYIRRHLYGSGRGSYRRPQMPNVRGKL